jgi:hypothetical protein
LVRCKREEGALARKSEYASRDARLSRRARLEGGERGVQVAGPGERKRGGLPLEARRLEMTKVRSDEAKKQH